MPRRVIYVLRSWPRLSQTFVLNEVLALEQRGLELAIFSLVHSGEDVVHRDVAKVRAPVTILTSRRRVLRRRLHTHLDVLSDAPVRYVATLRFLLRHPRLAAGYGSCTAWQCFGHAVTVAASIATMRRAGDGPEHVHAHFAHDPALVGLLAARLTGLSFSFTGHARDLLQIPGAALTARAAAATAVVTCCQANADHIRSTVSPADLPPVHVVHHGVDLDRFRPAPDGVGKRVLRILSVGRLVEKKGFDDLLRALAELRSAGRQFSCDVYGDGPLHDELLELRDRLGLQAHVAFRGACASETIVAALSSADVFALAPRTTGDGDRDGIPNVLVEAMACGIPVVTTSAGGVPELVRNEDNGLLTDPGDVPGLAAALDQLLDDPLLRRRLGAAGRATVEQDYDVAVAARTLEGFFGTTRRPRSAGTRDALAASS